MRFPAVILLLLFICRAVPLMAKEKAEETALFPRETEAIVSINLGNFSSYNLPDEMITKLKNFKAFNTGLQEFQKEIDFDLIKDFFSWPRGSLYIGIVRTGDNSPSAELLSRTEDIGKLTRCKLNMHEIARSLDRYCSEEDHYPPSLDALPLKELPRCPAGGTYRYTPGGDGLSYTLECGGNCHHEDTLDYHLVYTSERGLEIKEKNAGGHTNPAGNIITIIPVRDYDGAQSSMEKILSRLREKERITMVKQDYLGTALYTPTGAVKGSFALNRRYFFMSDNPEVITCAIDCINNRRASLAKNTRYLAYLASLPENVTATVFVDIHDIVEKSRKLLSEDSKTMEFLNCCQSAGGWADFRRRNIRGEAALAFTPGKITENIEKIAALPGKKALLDMLPCQSRDISNFALIDVFSFLEIFGTLPIPSRKGGETLSTQEIINRKLGPSWKEEARSAVSGRLSFTYEAGEIMLDALFPGLGADRNARHLERCSLNLSNIGTAMDFYAADHRGALPSDLNALVPGYMAVLPRCPAGGDYILTAQPDRTFRITCSGSAHKAAGVTGDNPYYSSVDGTGGTEGTRSTKEKNLASVPFMAGIQLNSRGSSARFLQKFTAGETFITTDYKDRQISVSRNEDKAYAFIGTTLFLENGGNAPGKIKKTIDAMLDGRKSLAQSKSFLKFRENLSGTVICLSHDRVDWLFSLCRGFLLLAGSDFREWARNAGEYQEAWSAMMVEPKRVRLIFEISAE